MIESNIIQFPRRGETSSIGIDDQRKAAQVAWLRGLADAWEADTTGMRIGVALFVEGQDGEGRVQAAGFADDRAAIRYFASWALNNGLAE